MEELKEKIDNLEERIGKLEKIEKRRRIAGVVKTVCSLLLFLAIIIAGYTVYTRIMDEIQPYREIVDSYSEFDFNNIFGNITGKKKDQ